MRGHSSQCVNLLLLNITACAKRPDTLMSSMLDNIDNML